MAVLKSSSNAEKIAKPNGNGKTHYAVTWQKDVSPPEL